MMGLSLFVSEPESERFLVVFAYGVRGMPHVNAIIPPPLLSVVSYM